MQQPQKQKRKRKCLKKLKMATSYNTALNYLSRREHSRLELKQKLSAKNFSPTEIDDALNKLQEKKLQSDERFAENYVRYRKHMGFGPLKINAELHERGVSHSVISSTVNENAEEWKTIMISLWKKKFSNNAKNKSTQYRFLLSRGFTLAMINQCDDCKYHIEAT